MDYEKAIKDLQQDVQACEGLQEKFGTDYSCEIDVYNLAIDALKKMQGLQDVTCYKVEREDRVDSYVIKVLKLRDLDEFDENTFLSFEEAEEKCRVLKTGSSRRPTSPKEFAEKMAESKKKCYGEGYGNYYDDNFNYDIIRSDPEEGHYELDEIMCKLLRELGYGKGVDIFESVERWYA